ncbi:unnamed protein product, partial [Cyprideis torosa]
VPPAEEQNDEGLDVPRPRVSRSPRIPPSSLYSVTLASNKMGIKQRIALSEYWGKQTHSSQLQQNSAFVPVLSHSVEPQGVIEQRIALSEYWGKQTHSSQLQQNSAFVPVLRQSQSSGFGIINGNIGQSQHLLFPSAPSHQATHLTPMGKMGMDSDPETEEGVVSGVVSAPTPLEGFFYINQQRRNQAPLPPHASGGLRMNGIKGASYVSEGQDVTLTCDYDLEGLPLYEVRWYKGDSISLENQISRYPFKTYDIYKFISSDHTSSDAQSLYLRGVTREASDTYCCEVKVGGPRYLTRNACAELVVAVRGRLSIDGVYSGQEVRGEKEVHANCTYAGSNPYANLQWYMDGLKVPDLNGSRCYPQGSVIQYPPESQNGLEVAFLGLMVRFCPQRGLSFAHPVSLHLECRAEVANVYYDNQTVNITIWDPAQPVTKFEPRYPAFGNSYTSSAAPCCSPLLLPVSMFVVLLDLVSQISLSRSCEASET